MQAHEIVIGLVGTGFLGLTGWFLNRVISKLDSIGDRLTVLETTMHIKCS